jgi:hypothetical protein
MSSLVAGLYPLTLLLHYACRYPANQIPRVQALSQDEGQDVCSHAPTCPWHRVMPTGMGSSGVSTTPVVPVSISWLGVAQLPPHVPWPQLLSLGSGQLECCHGSCNVSSRLLAQGSSRASMFPVAPTPTSWPRAAPEPSRVLWSSTSCGLLK